MAEELLAGYEDRSNHHNVVVPRGRIGERYQLCCVAANADKGLDPRATTSRAYIPNSLPQRRRHDRMRKREALLRLNEHCGCGGDDIAYLKTLNLVAFGGGPLATLTKVGDALLNWGVNFFPMYGSLYSGDCANMPGIKLLDFSKAISAETEATEFSSTKAQALSKTLDLLEPLKEDDVK
ncbi:hypothetical protein B0H14DRAFT_3775532 [Mycena olivaceomarginata]|nr:hypothetical protein B0H14DRAFT_3775532 [Mycena olivaceomarginata]